jgi:DNA-binding response OmpR family regulator
MKKILIIDDDPDIRGILEKLLARNGFKTLTACNGCEGLRLFRQEQPDLVLSDLIMPDKEGFETMRELKAEDPAVKIFVISGGGRMVADDCLVLAEKFGARRTFKKPFSCAEVLAAVEEELGPAAIGTA